MSFGVNKKDVSMKLKAQNFTNLQKTRQQTQELEVESQKMQDRLQELKMAMSREREEREGGFWKTGQKGILGKYAQDVLTKPSKSDKAKKKSVKMIKDEPLVLPDRPKGPGTFANLAQRSTGNKENEHSKANQCGQCEQKNAHVTCLECAEDYCARCFATFHLKGALKKHHSVPIGSGSVRTPRGPPPPNNNQLQPVPDGRSITTPTDISFSISQSGDSSRQSTARSSAQNGHLMPADAGRVMYGDTPRGSGDGSLLHGDYDERKAASEFQEALREWRGEKKPVVVSPVRSPTVQVEEGIGTDEPLSSPVEINFKPTLSYAERLLLKQHRRTALTPTGSETLPQLSKSGSMSARSSRSSRGLPHQTLDEDLFTGERVRFEQLADAMSPKTQMDMSVVEAEHDRPESVVSIVPVEEDMWFSQSMEQTSSYEVTEVQSSEILTPPPPNPAFLKHRDSVEEILPEPAPAPKVTHKGKKGKQTPNRNNSAAHDVVRQTSDLQLDLSPLNAANPSLNTSSKKSNAASKRGSARSIKPASAKSSRPASAKSTVKRTARATGDGSGGTSRASSRVSSNGENRITAEASGPLKELASLARQMTMDIVSNTQSNLEHLEDFFTFGVEEENNEPPVERTITPSINRRPTSSRPSSARPQNGRPSSARPQSGRPLSARGKTPSEVDKYKLSNKVYQMSTRSWRPDASTADVVDEDQIQQIVDDDFYKQYVTPREDEAPTLESWTGLPWTDEDANQSVPIQTVNSQDYRLRQPHPPPTPPKSASKIRRSVTPRSSRHPGDWNTMSTHLDQGDEEQQVPVHHIVNSRPSSVQTSQLTRPFSASQREKSTIVMEGEDLSKYDTDATTAQEEQNLEDQDAIQQLEWELASHREHSIHSRMSMRDDDLDSLDSEDEATVDNVQMERALTQEDIEKQFDMSSNKLRESEFMNDFEDMEEKYQDEEEVRHLNG